ncbi:hypothetical protein BJF93_14955 [Xaviernesmea oryzae]|uniref:Rieske domain-containing protein n=1 Tax=Xaviernesmea oryzae TaxID=464029 RepID=A0A1Q9AXV8_9HYPH|nr:Rieske (2Fe-2S) protein [Xaviernesmea oryzae]OLP60259.1 hypothetical protein BJF93_14955 [Xaviernesmea oryzae]SEK25986.1 Rieske [2Fe-2S] domain-containing protein [Xaviernesmea oryzae]
MSRLATQWLPVALSADIEPSTSAGLHVEGHELVVWRDASGNAHVWEDRCPHRGMRLSFGFVRGDHIACLYHGWQYDAAGQCRHIPAHPQLDVPQTIRVPRLAAREAAGLIWATEQDSLTFPPAAETVAAEPVQTLAINTPVDRLADALSKAGWVGDGTFGRLDVEGLRLIVGLHPANDGKALMHVLVEAGMAGPRARIEAARFAQALRDRIEAGVAIPGEAA